MLVNGNFNAVIVADSALAERTGAAYEPATAMPQLAVEGLDHARTVLADVVSSGGQYLRVGTPGIGKVACVAVVAAGQRLPEPRKRCGAPAQHPGHDAPAGALNGQPKPHLALLATHKRPHFIAFRRFPALALRFFRPQPGQRRC